MSERYTELFRRAMQLAHHEAMRLNHEYVGTEHLLYSLVRLGEGVAAEVLGRCGITREAVIDRLAAVMAPGPLESVIGRLPHTPRAQQAVTWAAEEARFPSHDSVCTEHLLMGLLHVPQGVAAVVLNQLGLTVDVAREEVMRLVPPGTLPADAAPTA